MPCFRTYPNTHVRKGTVSDTMNPEQPIWIAEILKLVNGASFDSGWK
ncbi:hypothetical protein GBP346_A0021 [Burkholderia pseudomallei MSHR346]|nr:hypothetical protein GBP346_A0021 [Burkholderia pseudomallei MSHR346]